MSARQRRQVDAGYEGKDDPTERDRILHCIDHYRASEGFAGQYLERWADLTLDPGLRTILDDEWASLRRLVEMHARASDG